MSKYLNDVTPSGGGAGTLHVAVEVSDRSWIIGIGDPDEPGRTGMHGPAPADTAGLMVKIGRAGARAGCC